jgi:hypothetical protein
MGHHFLVSLGVAMKKIQASLLKVGQQTQKLRDKVLISENSPSYTIKKIIIKACEEISLVYKNFQGNSSY